MFVDLIGNATISSLGVGVGLTRDTSTLMVGQYFKRRRDIVEIFLGKYFFYLFLLGTCIIRNTSFITFTVIYSDSLKSEAFLKIG